MAEDFDISQGEQKEPRISTNDLVEYGEFKGNKMIKLKKKPDDEYPFQFGVAKAKLILDNIEAIEDFVRDNKKN